ncbi:MAG: hypothetical protein ACJAYC_003621 [Halieaceae bacterium]|jgi:hypothetical protein
MSIYVDKKFIFFHIQRCEDTSLESHFRFRDPAALFNIMLISSQVLMRHHLIGNDEQYRPCLLLIRMWHYPYDNFTLMNG